MESTPGLRGVCPVCPGSFLLIKTLPNDRLCRHINSWDLEQDRGASHWNGIRCTNSSSMSQALAIALWQDTVHLVRLKRFDLLKRYPNGTLLLIMMLVPGLIVGWQSRTNDITPLLYRMEVWHKTVYGSPGGEMLQLSRFGSRSQQKLPFMAALYIAMVLSHSNPCRWAGQWFSSSADALCCSCAFMTWHDASKQHPRSNTSQVPQ